MHSALLNCSQGVLCWLFSTLPSPIAPRPWHLKQIFPNVTAPKRSKEEKSLDHALCPQRRGSHTEEEAEPPLSSYKPSQRLFHTDPWGPAGPARTCWSVPFHPFLHCPFPGILQTPPPTSSVYQQHPSGLVHSPFIMRSLSTEKRLQDFRVSC